MNSWPIIKILLLSFTINTTGIFAESDLPSLNMEAILPRNGSDGKISSIDQDRLVRFLESKRCGAHFGLMSEEELPHGTHPLIGKVGWFFSYAGELTIEPMGLCRYQLTWKFSSGNSHSGFASRYTAPDGRSYLISTWGQKGQKMNLVFYRFFSKEDPEYGIMLGSFGMRGSSSLDGRETVFFHFKSKAPSQLGSQVQPHARTEAATQSRPKPSLSAPSQTGHG